MRGSNRRLEIEVERAAQQEGLRLAQDLHDSVTQALFAASIKAESLTMACDLPGRESATLEDVRRLSRGALAHMRLLLLELRSDPLEKIPLPQLLRQLVEATESRVSADVWLSQVGLGLRVMRGRAEEAGAELCLDSGQGCQGTRVIVAWHGAD